MEGGGWKTDSLGDQGVVGKKRLIIEVAAGENTQELLLLTRCS